MKKKKGTMDSLPEVTSDEIHQRESSVIVLDGIVYDFVSFIRAHPDGRDCLARRDAASLKPFAVGRVSSSHPLPSNVLLGGSRGPIFIGVDVGGTKVLAVAVDPHGRILSRFKLKTGGARGPDAVAQRVIEAASQCIKALNNNNNNTNTVLDVASMGLAVPGPVDVEKCVVLRAVNLGWDSVDIGAMQLQRMMSDVARVGSVHVDNDANMGAYGEAMMGAAVGEETVYGVFVGTGLGGGLVRGGELVRGAKGTCGEVGHTCIDIRKNAQQCGCGAKGCLETRASKSGMLKWMKQKGTKTDLDTLSPGWREEGGQVPGSKVLKKCVRKGDVLVCRGLTRMANALGAGVANILTTSGADCVVLGGGIICELGKYLMPKVLESVKKHSFAGETHCSLVKVSALGDYAVAVGAAKNAMHRSQKKH